MDTLSLDELKEKIEELGDLKDKPVTWENLLQVLFQIVETIKASDDATYEVIDAMTDAMQKLYDESEYRNMRRMAFTLGMAGHRDYSQWRPMYDKYCEEFDKLNRKDDQ